jgi:hypothetical protein
MTSLADARVLFVAAAGPRRGLSQLAQYLLLARAHGMRPLVAMPGMAANADAALALGADVIAGATPRLIETMRPDVIVVDDVVAAQTGSWIISAQRAGVLVLDVNEMGLGTDNAGVDPNTALLPAVGQRVALQAARR